MSNLPISNHLTERHRFIQCKKKKKGNDIIAYNDHRNVRNYSVFIYIQANPPCKIWNKRNSYVDFFYCNILGVFWPFHDSSNLVCGNLLYIITFMI